MNQRTKILAESIVEELTDCGREDIVAMSLLRLNRHKTEMTLKLRLSVVKASINNLIKSNKRKLKYGEKETRGCRA